MSGLLTQTLIITLFCLVVGETAISSDTATQHTAKELIDKIIESENKIKDVQAEYVFFEPDTNLPILYAQWACHADTELIAGLGFNQAGSDLGYVISRRVIFSLDDKQRFYNYHEETQKVFRQLIIKPPEPFDLGMFTSYMAPKSLLGFDISGTSQRGNSRISFGQALKEAQKVILKEQTEKIDGYDCYFLEAIGIENQQLSYDVRTWVDIERGYRPLRVDIFYNTLNERKYDSFERLTRRICDVKLKRINGIWFPIEGKRDNFRYKEVLPPELEGLTEEQTLERFSQAELEELEKKIEEVRLPLVPTRKILIDIDSIRINQGIDPNRFVIKPPSGYEVWDNIEDRHHAVEDGNVTDRKLDVSYLKLTRFAPPEFMKVIYPDTLIGCNLHDLTQFQTNLSPYKIKGKPLLLCIWDMLQRPSRAFIKELAGRSKNLQQKGFVVVGIQASKVEENDLEEWIKTNGISFPVIMPRTDDQETTLLFAAKSLPCLILTDKQHVVTPEGFGHDELNERINMSTNQ